MENINYNITYQSEVKLALDEVVFYYAQKGGKDLAERMFDNIILQLEALQTMPFRCQVTDFSKNIRKMIIQKPPYLAYYTVIDTEVIILELVHASKDQDLIRQKYENF